jgi:hypothetical protein
VDYSCLLCGAFTRAFALFIFSYSYTTLIKRLLPRDDNVNMGLFFGYVGAVNA